jgi:hypothetical protein
MDLDAILKRRPQLVLVDELAHSNAEGSRHPKRYQDVEELLSAGIDVYSTINIQHIESLNDVVARITHVRIRETVPDSVFDTADDVEIVDLTPDELIRRLHEGKVYAEQQAQRALENYFKTGNLTALRELALRRTAERVDEQMRHYMRKHAIQGPWAAGERVLVCINESAGAAELVRTAKRAADRLDAGWFVIYFETARTQHLTASEQQRVAQTLFLAKQLGAETLTLPGSRRIADDTLRFARDNNITWSGALPASPSTSWPRDRRSSRSGGTKAFCSLTRGLENGWGRPTLPPICIRRWQWRPPPCPGVPSSPWCSCRTFPWCSCRRCCGALRATACCPRWRHRCCPPCATTFSSSSPCTPSPWPIRASSWHWFSSAWRQR